jgi:hypothetical protein
VLPPYGRGGRSPAASEAVLASSVDPSRFRRHRNAPNGSAWRRARFARRIGRGRRAAEPLWRREPWRDLHRCQQRRSHRVVLKTITADRLRPSLEWVDFVPWGFRPGCRSGKSRFHDLRWAALRRPMCGYAARATRRTAVSSRTALPNQCFLNALHTEKNCSGER